MPEAWGVAEGRMCTAFGGLAPGIRQSSPRTPAQLAPGQEMAAGSHRHECQALDKWRVCTERALGRVCVGNYEKAAKPSTEEGSLAAQEVGCQERMGTGCPGHYHIQARGGRQKGTPRHAQRVVTPLTLKTSP